MSHSAQRTLTAPLMAPEALDLGLAVTAGGVECTMFDRVYRRPPGASSLAPLEDGVAAFMVAIARDMTRQERTMLASTFALNPALRERHTTSQMMAEARIHLHNLSESGRLRITSTALAAKQSVGGVK